MGLVDWVVGRGVLGGLKNGGGDFAGSDAGEVVNPFGDLLGVKPNLIAGQEHVRNLPLRTSRLIRRAGMFSTVDRSLESSRVLIMAEHDTWEGSHSDATF